MGHSHGMPGTSSFCVVPILALEQKGMPAYPPSGNDPQSSQSVPSSQCFDHMPGRPSSQMPSLAYGTPQSLLHSGSEPFDGGGCCCCCWPEPPPSSHSLHDDDDID